LDSAIADDEVYNCSSFLLTFNQQRKNREINTTERIEEEKMWF